MTEVLVLEESDGFEIVIKNYAALATEKRFKFSQEESIAGLVQVFEELGFNTQYEEVY